MNTPLLIANILTLLAFFVHTFMGDRELKLIEPNDEQIDALVKREKWTMVRSGWHWISADLLLLTVGLGIINFSNTIPNEQLLLIVIVVCCFAWGLAWLIGIMISTSFSKNYLKLAQWLLLWVIGGLVYWGMVLNG